MDYLIQFQMNIYTLLMLGILFWMIRTKSWIESFGKRLIENVIILTAVALIIDPLSWIVDEQMFFGSYFLGYLFNLSLIALAPHIGGMMLSYVDYYIFKDKNRIKQRLYYMHFVIITMVLLIINIFVPIYFSISMDTHTYAAGNYLWIHNVLIATMYLYMLVFVTKNRKKTLGYIMNIFMIFFILPIIGMVVQIINTHLNFAWTSIGLGVLVTYVFLESSSGEKDYLTRLFSRQSYERYVLHLIENKRSFSIALIDLDNFKTINDQYGHLKGDQVLVKFGNVLKKVFYPNKLVSRLAGDEFIVVIENDQSYESVKTEIEMYLSKSEDSKCQSLEYSMGWQHYESGMTLDQLYRQVDGIMYEHKKKKLEKSV